MRIAHQSLILITLVAVSLWGLTITPIANSTPADSKPAKLKIVPLVALKPGETKELLLSTWCTVGATRGGGFKLAEMKNGRPQYNPAKHGKSYSRDGVTITVPSFEEGRKFANSDGYVVLRDHDLSAFKVTISAAKSAKPGFMQMHLVDTTCSGKCDTDFRVLIVER